jgi:MYXO-CTERM domain-containing protein
VIRFAFLAASLLLLATTAAYGNGRFPSAQEFHQGPGANSDLMVVRTTFGLVVSVDRGRHWEYWCEDALLYGDGYDPPLTYAADGTMMVALEDGLVTTRNGCTFRRQPDLESLTVKDLASSPDGRVTWAIAVTRNATPDSRVARSTDNGLTFDFVGDRFPGVVLQTIEVAGSDPMRLYASGTLNADGRAVLYRSVDGGARWERAGLSFGEATGVYVSGVDGRHPEVLYLRATAASSEMDAGSAQGAGVLLRSDDGGETVREVLRTRGPMRGFAISDDGRSVWGGGPDDGVWRSVDGAAPTRFSDEPVDCLRWSDGSLWACRAFVPGGPLLLRSDGEASFVTALSAADVGGPPPRCPAGTLSHDVCPGRWSVVRRSLVPPTLFDASTDRGAVIAPAPPADCGCRAGSAPRAPGVALVGLALALSRRWRRPLRRPAPAARS